MPPSSADRDKRLWALGTLLLSPTLALWKPIKQIDGNRIFREQIVTANTASLTELEKDPIHYLLLTGKAQTAAEAEEMYLNASLPEVLRLLQSPLSDEELGRHPLLVLFRRHGSRGWEDSLL